MVDIIEIIQNIDETLIIDNIAVTEVINIEESPTQIIENINETVTIEILDDITIITKEQDSPIVITQSERGYKGDKGDSGDGNIYHNFSYGDATPFAIANVPQNTIIYKITVLILTYFNNPATLTIGDSGDNSRLFNIDNLDLSSKGTYDYFPNYKYDSNTSINLYITLSGGITQGNGLIIIYSK